ncbi:MAG: glycosyltransferase family 39 protein [Patescibacteria group bacterium]
MHYQNDKTNNDRSAFLPLLGLIIFVIAIAFLFFTQQSLRLDEAQSLWQTSHTPTKILNIIAQDVHVPFYHMILHFWQLFLGNTVETGRALSLIFFVLSIPAMYFLGKRAFNRNVALFATTLYAVSPFMNWYGSEIRMYSLLTLLTILSQYFFLGIYKLRDGDSWIGYSIVALFGIFTHYFFFFVLLVQALFYFIYRPGFAPNSLKKFITIAVLLVLIFSPWVYYMQIQGSGSTTAPMLTAPSTIDVFNSFSQFLFGFQNDHMNTLLVSLWPITVLLGFLALRENEKVSSDAVYMLMSILIPMVAAFVVSVTLRPLFVSRYLILTIPSLYLFIGWVFSTYPKQLQNVVKAVLIFAMLASLAIEIVSPTTPTKENYREAVTYLEQRTTAQDVIVLSAPFTRYPVEYYYRGPAELTTLPIWNQLTGAMPQFSEEKLPEEINTIKQGHKIAWVLLSYDQGYSETIRLYMDNNFERIDTHVFSPDLKLYVYKLNYDEPIFGQATSQ